MKRNHVDFRTVPCLLALAMLSLVGCNQDPIRAKLIGTWKIEYGDKLTQRVNQDDELMASPEDDPRERMTITFYSSGSLKTQTRIGQVNREKNGSWELVSFDDEESQMNIRCELMDQQTEHKVQFIESDLIRLVPPNMAGTRSKLKFRRK